MSTKAEQLQEAWHLFEQEREHRPCGTREAVEWAVSNGLLELPLIDPYDQLASQMASALREETRMDSQGRHYRVNHAVRVLGAVCRARSGAFSAMRATITWPTRLPSVASRSSVIAVG